MVLQRDGRDPELIYRIEPGEPYFNDLSKAGWRVVPAADTGMPRAPY